LRTYRVPFLELAHLIDRPCVKAVRHVLHAAHIAHRIVFHQRRRFFECPTEHCGQILAPIVRGTRQSCLRGEDGAAEARLSEGQGLSHAFQNGIGSPHFPAIGVSLGSCLQGCAEISICVQLAAILPSAGMHLKDGHVFFPSRNTDI
jgi:hypothetical protein